jgi:hypothetical protein
VSFDASVDIDSVLFDDEDVLEFTPTGNAWELAYDGSAAHSNWPAADLTAFAAVVANESAPTAPTIGGSQPGPDGRGTGGLIVGTNRLFGSGTPHGKPGDECIAIFEVGPNGNPDNPPGSIDDELLGTGGTDENGVFVDAMSNPGIPLTRQVREGDRVFAVDVCEGLLVGHVIGFVAPTPVLSGLALFALTALLLLFGIWKVASGDKLRPNGEEF